MPEARGILPEPFILIQAQNVLPARGAIEKYFTIEAAVRNADDESGDLIAQLVSPNFNGNGTNFNLWRTHFHAMTQLRVLLKEVGSPDVIGPDVPSNPKRVTAVMARNTTGMLRLLGTRIFSMTGELQFDPYDRDRERYEQGLSPSEQRALEYARLYKRNNVAADEADDALERTFLRILRQVRTERKLWHNALRL